MAGTLTISTLSDGTNSTSSTNCIQGSAKAWIRYNGSTASIIGSYNVSSVTVASAGNYTINFTNALPNANYTTIASVANISTACGLVNIGTTGPNGNSNNFSSGNITTTGVKITVFNISQAQGNSEYVSVACYS